MKFRSLIGSAVFAVGLVAATAAGAQGIIIDQGGVRVVPPSQEVAPPPPGRWDRGPDYGANDQQIGPREARRIARSAGLIETYGVDRQGRVWVVEGADRRGRPMRVVISARSGDIVNVDRARRG
ncbi:MAG TPA: hypothetical protein VNX29_19710 [Kaistia sp.]|nr:hypothetical protein [Kaistia sp.]